MSWGTSWAAKDIEDDMAWPSGVSLKLITEYKPSEDGAITKVDLAGGPVWVPNVGVVIEAINEKKNKVPTHDPYTNPDAQLYYSCPCGAILDPGVKRFAELNNCASNSGWKIRFSDSGYIPYCVDCGKGVE